MTEKRKRTGAKRPARGAKARVVRMSVAEARRKPDRTDYARLDAMTDADIARQIAKNPDTIGFTDEMLKQAEVVFPPAKQLLSLRVDQDVVAWFRSLGDGYQTRMNAVLRSYMKHGPPRRVVAEPKPTRKR